MIRYNYLILILLLSINDIVGQSITKKAIAPMAPSARVASIDSCQIDTLIFDFNEKVFLNDCAMGNFKIGNYYHIKIINFEPEKYTLTLNGKSDENATTSTNLTSSLGLGDLTALVAAIGSNSVAGVLPIVESVIPQANQSDFIDLIDGLGRVNFTAAASKMSESSQTNSSSAEPKKGEVESKEIATIPEDLKIGIRKVGGIISESADTVLQIHQDIWQSFFYYSNLKYEDKNSRTNIRVEFANAIKDLRKRVFDAIIRINAGYQTFETLELDKIYITNKELRTEANNKITLLNTAKTNLLAALSELEKSLSVDNYLKVVDLLNDTKDKNKSLEYTSHAIQFNSPQQQITISAKTNKGFESFQGFDGNYTLPQKTFFSGLSYNIFLNKISNDAFSTQRVINGMDTLFQFVPENNGEIQFGVSAMYNYGNRIFNSDKYHWHIGAGIGATFSEKIQPRVLFGGGLAIGKSNKLMLTLGVAFGPSDKLSSVYEENGKYAQRPSAFTVNTLKGAGFISIGYTL